MNATLALVESPAQLLHLLEWCWTNDSVEQTTAAVLAPRDASTVRQLRAMRLLAEEEGLRVHWLTPRASAKAGLSALGALRRAVGKAEELVIGDPFSGLVQSLLPWVAPATEVVVVDDGTATLEFVAQLDAGAPLQRWDRGRKHPFRAPLAHAAGRVLRSRNLSMFTVMAVSAGPRRLVQRHRYEWTRRRFGQPTVVDGIDVIGSSLVESGLVQADAYLEAVAEAVQSCSTPGRYFAHRREHPDKLRRVAERTQLEIVTPEFPLEIEVRRGPVAATLAGFPSSTGYTLPLVLDGTGVRVQVSPLAPPMLQAGVTPSASDFLHRVAADLQQTARHPADDRLGPWGVRTTA